MRINYTTYDVRRAQDTINPNTDRRDIMLLSPQKLAGSDSCHQYQYTRVLGIYHANVIYMIQNRYHSRRMEFLLVRYFEVIEDVPVQRGWSVARLDKLKFHPMGLDGAFGFVDPDQVIRGCHLIPRFCNGKLQPVSMNREKARPLSAFARDHEDWKVYYVNRSTRSYQSSLKMHSDCRFRSRFVDRDMIMRYHWGLGVGHLYAHRDGHDNGMTVQQSGNGSDSDSDAFSDADGGEVALANDSSVHQNANVNLNAEMERPTLNDGDDELDDEPEVDWNREDYSSESSDGGSDLDSDSDSDSWVNYDDILEDTLDIDVTSYD